MTLVQSEVFLRKLGQARMYTAMSGCTKKKSVLTQKKRRPPHTVRYKSIIYVLLLLPKKSRAIHVCTRTFI